MAEAQKNRASKNPYVSPNQLNLVGFESPFSQSLDPNNRWVVLAGKIPWDLLVNTYQQQLNNGRMGADGINPRVAIGAMILKHLCDTRDNKPLNSKDKSDKYGNDQPRIDPVCDETAPG